MATGQSMTSRHVPSLPDVWHSSPTVMKIFLYLNIIENKDIRYLKKAYIKLYICICFIITNI